MLQKKFSPRRLLECSAAAGLVLAVVLSCWFSTFAGTCAGLRDSTLRLHVKANSDSAADQALKLQVRDAVLAQTGDLFARQTDKAQAIQAAQANLDRIQAAAEEAVAKAGSQQAVRVYLTNMYFDTTVYDRFTLPAGRYDALRVELGSSQGHNWFCVLYPGLCLPAAEEKTYADPAQQTLLEESGGYEIRFAALEAVERAAEWLRAKAESE